MGEGFYEAVIRTLAESRETRGSGRGASPAERRRARASRRPARGVAILRDFNYNRGAPRVSHPGNAAGFAPPHG